MGRRCPERHILQWKALFEALSRGDRPRGMALRPPAGGVCAYPVKAAPDNELNFSDLPQWMKKVDFLDPDQAMGKLRSATFQRLRRLWSVLRKNFAQREKEFRPRNKLLFSADRK